MTAKKPGRNPELGFYSSFAKDDKAVKQLINAGRNNCPKPSFQKAFKFHRCVILADSFTNGKDFRRQDPDAFFG